MIDLNMNHGPTVGRHQTLMINKDRIAVGIAVAAAGAEPDFTKCNMFLGQHLC